MSENENEQIRAEYEQMEETFWEQTQSGTCSHSHA